MAVTTPLSPGVHIGQSTVCPFCARVAAGDIDLSWPGCVAFEPRSPLVPGHLLVLPRRHVADAAVDPQLTAVVMRCAAEVVQRRRRLDADLDHNLITSIGSAATQSVPHLHVHVVPRWHGDGLRLPWTARDGMVTG